MNDYSTNQPLEADEDDDVTGTNIITAAQSNNTKAKKKRKKKNRSNTKELNGMLLTSLMLLEEDQDKCIAIADDDDRNHKTPPIDDDDDDKLALESNHNKRSRVMMDYYSNIQDYYSDIQQFDRSSKRLSSSVAIAVTSAAVGLQQDELSRDTVKHGTTINTTGQQQQRRLWVKDRDKAWWDECNSPDYPDEEFKKAFRMSKSTFELICDELHSVVAKEDTTLRNAIPVRQRVAVCIWRLATGEPLRLVSKRVEKG
ncbi:hypothetical protein LINPERHAP2_LOCUS479 [Linum perenne]